MDPKDVLADPEYQNANLETKRVIFARLVAKDPAYANANAETQREIDKIWGILDPEPPKASNEPARSESNVQQPPAERPSPLESDTGLLTIGGGAALGSAGSFLPKVTGTSPAQIQRAQERLATAQDKLAEAQRAAASGPAGQTRTAADLRAAHDAARAEVDIARQELSAANQALREASRAAPAAVSEISDVISSGRASGPKIEGDSGVRNWMIQEAGQEHAVPNKILDMATGKTKDDPLGAKYLINKDLENIEKIKKIGGADFKLAGEGKSQLMMTSEEAARVEQELAQRQAAQSSEQARLAQLAEQDRLARELELQQRQQQARTRQRTAGQTASQTGQQAKEAAQLEKGVAKAQSGVNIAGQAAERAEKSVLGPFQKFGASVASSKLLAPLLGGLGAAGTLMSADEAVRRFNAGDRSGAVISALEAAFGAMSMMPAWNPVTAGIKGVGTVGGLAMSGGELSKYLYDMYKNSQQPEN